MIWDNIFNIEESSLRVKTGDARNIPVRIPRGQVSKEPATNITEWVNNNISFVTSSYQFEVVPVIRKLKDVNPDVSQAFKDVLQLANTGHNIVFDPATAPEQQVEMRREIYEASKEWVEGCSGMNGIINKMFAQALIGGAIANEWVPNMRLDGISKIKFIKPETIRYAKVRGQIKYQPYQKVDTFYGNGSTTRSTSGIINGQYVKLNTATFRYVALISDAESPYGLPPYMAALTPVGTQNRMLNNVDQIISNMGLLGWAEALMYKPDQIDGESDKQYQARLETLLKELKSRAKEQLRDGISVGFMDDHQFTFQSTDINAGGVDTLWANNEQQIASALDFDPSFMGRSYNSSETMVTILFTKMLSQLSNIQEIVQSNLNYGINLFLRLKGYKFQSVHVEFERSTITDDLKYQQAAEIRQRVAMMNYLMGTIDEQQYAEEMGYTTYDSESPRVSPEVLAGKGQQARDEGDQQDKDDASARRSRDKRNPQGSRRTRPPESTKNNE